MASTTSVQTHIGSYQSIPADASPGLLFLKDFLPAFDSLGPFKEGEEIPLANLLFQNSKFVYERDPPLDARAKLNMIRLRSKGVCRIEREVEAAHDHDLDDGFGRRRVIFESTTTTRFTNDPPGVVIVVKETTTMDLLPTDTPDRGSNGLKMGTLRVFTLRQNTQ